MPTKITPFRLDQATLDRLQRKGLPMAAQLRLDVATAAAWEAADICDCCRQKLLLLRADTTISEAAADSQDQQTQDAEEIVAGVDKVAKLAADRIMARRNKPKA